MTEYIDTGRIYNQHLYTVATAVNGCIQSQIGAWTSEADATAWMNAHDYALASLERTLVEEHVEGGSGDPADAEAFTFVAVIATPEGLGWDD